MHVELQKEEWLLMKRVLIWDFILRFMSRDELLEGKGSLFYRHEAIDYGEKICYTRLPNETTGSTEKMAMILSLVHDNEICLNNLGPFIDQIDKIIAGEGLPEGLQLGPDDTKLIYLAFFWYCSQIECLILEWEEGLEPFPDLYNTAGILSGMGDTEMKVNKDDIGFWEKEEEKIRMMLKKHFVEKF